MSFNFGDQGGFGGSSFTFGFGDQGGFGFTVKSKEEPDNYDFGFKVDKTSSVDEDMMESGDEFLKRINEKKKNDQKNYEKHLENIRKQLIRNYESNKSNTVDDGYVVVWYYEPKKNFGYDFNSYGQAIPVAKKLFEGKRGFKVQAQVWGTDVNWFGNGSGTFSLSDVPKNKWVSRKECATDHKIMRIIVTPKKF